MSLEIHIQLIWVDQMMKKIDYMYAWYPWARHRTPNCSWWLCVCVFTTGWVKCRVQIFATSLSLPFCIWHYKFSSQSGKFLHFKHEILTFCAKFEQHIYKVCLWIKLCISEVSEGDSQFQFHLSILNASPALWAIVLFFYYILIARKLF